MCDEKVPATLRGRSFGALRLRGNARRRCSLDYPGQLPGLSQRPKAQRRPGSHFARDGAQRWRRWGGHSAGKIICEQDYRSFGTRKRSAHAAQGATESRRHRIDQKMDRRRRSLAGECCDDARDATRGASANACYLSSRARYRSVARLKETGRRAWRSNFDFRPGRQRKANHRRKANTQ